MQPKRIRHNLIYKVCSYLIVLANIIIVEKEVKNKMLRIELNQIFLEKCDKIGVKSIVKGHGFLGGGNIFVEFYDGGKCQIELVSDRITKPDTDIPRTFLTKTRSMDIPINDKKDTQPAFKITSNAKDKKVIRKQKKTKCKKK